MARPLRIEFEGALYHVTSRGNERRRIFLDEHDYGRRWDWLKRTVETYGWLVHAFALMPNHDHLFVETPLANLSAGMQFLNGSYTSYFNNRHDRVGHLFQGRYKAILIESERHYAEVSRYIHLNPVRAGLAKRPEDCPWSSFPGYYRRQNALPWVTYARVLSEFGRDGTAARRDYRRFVDAGIGQKLEDPLRDAFHGLILGSEAFVTKVRKSLMHRPDDSAMPALRALKPRPSLDMIIAATARHFGADPADWGNGRRYDGPARAVAAYVARNRYNYGATATARSLGYSVASSVNQAMRRVENSKGMLSAAKDIHTKLAND